LLRVSHDWTLWKKPRFEKFEKSMEDVYLSYLKEDTTELFISCNDVPSSDYSVSHKFLIQLETKCPELQHLTLTNQVFDAGEVRIILPSSVSVSSILIDLHPTNKYILCVDKCKDFASKIKNADN